MLWSLLFFAIFFTIFSINLYYYWPIGVLDQVKSSIADALSIARFVESLESNCK